MGTEPHMHSMNPPCRKTSTEFILCTGFSFIWILVSTEEKGFLSLKRKKVNLKPKHVGHKEVGREGKS